MCNELSGIMTVHKKKNGTPLGEYFKIKTALRGDTRTCEDTVYQQQKTAIIQIIFHSSNRLRRYENYHTQWRCIVYKMYTMIA